MSMEILEQDEYKYGKTLANRILGLLDEHNITVYRLHTLSEISDNSLEKLVQGKTKNPKLSTIHAIAMAFNMSVSEFLNFQEMDDITYADLRKLKPQNNDENE